ncbi:MAG: undecaprenyl-diphosphatase UppP [Ignavibacteria bacterium CG_4_8_14_3_um_filter_37_9]|nr:undecaprenyl-diphosphatase UppP [Ignavibacteria bacterium]OIO19061.1 MAG: undecaprenyl-diphosphatase UppP [Ignavibacteria bacterium CG1_02_37_35]PIW98993.1 MAG: undecaprenyl-diphosphatase UppP [Ignavibacteria bacterium CG_4_8_14_3_um_filter_37_9]PIX95405.1 MAG: undecaprenyl-diphosphatase UppP [Ignavibacteria bacterium CG_4_10_14_3_um_filter_37_18]PJC61227.1 MAG: undecaprenyl-diphosphatase UppP [Ignavibacteria bacterium CG_4_9_14_0_2_um_filter_37_13]
MSIFEAIILGFIQGFSEFLPISSTGHLTIFGRMFHLISEENPQAWTSFIAVIQLGTLVAVLVYFWKDILHIVSAFLKENFGTRQKFSTQSLDAKMGWFIVLGTIPIVALGLSFKKIIEGTLTKNLVVIACSLIVLAVILAYAERKAKFNKEMKDITIFDSIVVGIAQAMALIPGSSRSGTTITGGLFMGLTRESAARFSFLLSIPSVFASGLLELYEQIKFIDHSGMVNLIVATIVSGISGYVAIDFLLKYLRKNTTFVFIYYRIALGGLILILISLNILKP